MSVITSNGPRDGSLDPLPDHPSPVNKFHSRGGKEEIERGAEYEEDQQEGTRLRFLFLEGSPQLQKLELTKNNAKYNYFYIKFNVIYYYY